MTRKETKQIRIGDVWIGGGNKIAIQSMTNTKTELFPMVTGRCRYFHPMSLFIFPLLWTLGKKIKIPA